MHFYETAFDELVRESDCEYVFNISGKSVSLPKDETDILKYFRNHKAGMIQIPVWLAVKEGLY